MSLTFTVTDEQEFGGGGQKKTLETVTPDHNYLQVARPRVCGLASATQVLLLKSWTFVFRVNLPK